MITFEMKYYNVYYYCNIISAVIENGGIDFASTLGEFKDRLWDTAPTDFPKCSMLHQFCEWAIDRIFHEEMTKDIEKIQDLVDQYQEKYNLLGSLEKAFFSQSEYSLNKEKHYKMLRIEDAILQYRHQEVRFFDWLMQHQEYQFFDDEFSDYIEALCNEGL